MLAVVVQFTLKPNARTDFLPRIQENAALSLKVEAGCHQFDIATDPARPDEVFLYELYSDAAAFEQHKRTAHFASFETSIAGMVAHKEVKTYEQVIQ